MAITTIVDHRIKLQHHRQTPTTKTHNQDSASFALLRRFLLSSFSFGFSFFPFLGLAVAFSLSLLCRLEGVGAG
jgi:hypothetical protein